MRLPSVLVPYPGPTIVPGEQDIAIYLRPESNGVRVESTMLRVIRSLPRFRERLRLAYLANLPGGFIAERGVVAEHYATRVYFARAGKRAFTPTMGDRFEAAFGLPFEDAPVFGAFEALGLLGLQAEELFLVRVPDDRFAMILGQTVKHYGGLYIVNYDIPALLQKHNETTDVFSMLLRSTVGYEGFPLLLRAVYEALRDEAIITGESPASRVFHFSSGPFEQILDGMGYLYAPDGTNVPIGEISFARYLLGNGEGLERIIEVVRRPIVRVLQTGGATAEVEIFDYTRFDDYPAALRKLRSTSSLSAPGPLDRYTPR